MQMSDVIDINTMIFLRTKYDKDIVLKNIQKVLFKVQISILNENGIRYCELEQLKSQVRENIVDAICNKDLRVKALLEIRQKVLKLPFKFVKEIQNHGQIQQYQFEANIRNISIPKIEGIEIRDAKCNLIC